MIVPIFDNLQMNIISKLKLTRIKVVKNNKKKIKKIKPNFKKVANGVKK